MNKIDSVHADLSKIFDNLDDFLQFEKKPEVYVFEYETNKKTYLATKVISSDTQFIIYVKKGNKVNEVIINSPEDDPKIFKIKNVTRIAFIPVDGQLLKLKSYKGRRCDFIFFDNNNFCFVEFKLNAKSDNLQTIQGNREDASNQLGDTIEFFNQKFLEYFKQTFIDFYQDMNLEAYMCTPQFYEQFPSRNTNGEFFLVDFYDKHQVALFEAREKDCQEVAKE